MDHGVQHPPSFPLPPLSFPCHCQVRLGLPATQWITVYNAHRPMKQRYHYNVANTRVDQVGAGLLPVGALICLCCLILAWAGRAFRLAVRVTVPARRGICGR